MKIFCHSCQTENLIEMPISRRAECFKCHTDLKCCLNCKFYDSNSHWECRESVSERVKDKDRANYCDFFVPSEQKGQHKQDQNDLLSAAEALFKKK